jgi:hypothetical protein
MPKAIIWFLIGIGFLILLIGLFFHKTPILIIGLLMFAGGLYLGLGPDGILRKEQVSDTWSILIENGQGRAEEIFQDTEAFIKASKVPSVGMERKAIAPGVFGGLSGNTRDFLVITDQRSLQLKPYKIFLNARDYGDNLDVSWYLTYKPTLLQAILSLLPFVSTISAAISDLNIFDQQDLRAYATNAHHCLMKAVEKIMAELHQDPSKMDRKSRGFLGIS